MKKYWPFTFTLVALFLSACSSASQPVEILLEANSMRYQPVTLDLAAGQPVRLTFRNNDTVDHDFSILEIPVTITGATADPMAGHDMDTMTTDPQLHVAAAAGATSTLEFTPSKSGTYEFYCTVTGHKEAGMLGTLTVKAP